MEILGSTWTFPGKKKNRKIVTDLVFVAFFFGPEAVKCSAVYFTVCSGCLLNRKCLIEMI